MRYKAFGLVFDSEIELPDLIPAPDDTPTDVEIRLGEVPDKLEGEVMGEGVLYSLNRTEFRLSVPDIADYYARNGEEIIISCKSRADDSSARLFLLGSTFGALFHQRGLLPIHASSIETPQGAVLFTGVTGSGKSTLAASFCKQGYRLISDDISVLTLNTNGQVVVYPGIPYQRLWEDTIATLNEDHGSLKRVRPDLKKYIFPVTENFVDFPVILSKIYVLSTDKLQPEPSFESIVGLNKLSIIYRSIYRPAFHHAMQLSNEKLSLGLAISQQVSLKICTYAHNSNQLDDLVDVFEEDFSNGK